MWLLTYTCVLYMPTQLVDASEGLEEWCDTLIDMHTDR